MLHLNYPQKKRNIKLVLSYEGTHYFGWQKTPTGPSIEESLETVLSHLLQHKVSLQAASRTDRGVHAYGQVVNFFTDNEMSLNQLFYALSGLLPKEIAPIDLKEMPCSFHPTLDCTGKEYHYYLSYHPVLSPFERSTSWHYPFFIDLKKIESVKDVLVGCHDFSAFSNERTDDSIREIFSIATQELPGSKILFSISGNRFLYKMVRNLVGTLVYIGCGKLPGEDLYQILKQRDRALAGITAPACGLFLNKVFYASSQ